MTLKIFSIYYSAVKAPDYRSDCYEPMMAGTDPHWAELTVHEKILKEWLPAHPDVDYVGFCHYRRFFDFWRKHPSKYLPHIGFDAFARNFSTHYASANILPQIDKADIVVPCTSRWSRKQKSVRENYESFHPIKDLECLVEIVRKDYPEMVPDMESYLAGRHSYQCLNFIMKRALFEEYLIWEQDILHKLAQQRDWSAPEYQTFYACRVPAFLAERFFNVFVQHKVRTRSAKVLERQLVLLVPDVETQPVAIVRRYLEFARDVVKGFLP